jgi:sigma-B regulation protein RsbU (phosphoserine phosphatase)
MGLLHTNLWTDVEALERLARTERDLERTGGSGGTRTVPAPGPLLRFPEREEFDIRAADLPARFVSGDYYDFFFVSEDRIALVMADVSGKGVPAALLKGVTRSVLRNLSAGADSPGETLDRLNRILHEADLGPMYVTIFLCWYSVRTGRLRYASAGHPSPFRVDRRGRVTPFGDATGPILGILDLDDYPVREARLAVGDRLVLFTDGALEARSPGGAFLGTSGLRRLIERHGSDPAQQLCDALARGVDEYQARRRHDDATFLVFERKR